MITRHANKIVLGLVGLLILAAIGIVLHERPVAPRMPGPTSSVSRPSPTAIPLSLSFTPTLAQQDGEVRVAARGFAPGESVVVQVPATKSAHAIDLAHTKASADGTVATAPITLPSTLYSGAHSVEAVGQQSGRHVAATLFVHAKAPWIKVSSYAVMPRDKFGLIVGGFAPRESVRISLAPAKQLPTGQSQDPSKLSKPVTLTTLSMDPSGNASWTEVRLPLLKPGGYTLTALGTSSGKKLTANLIAKALTPVGQLSPWAGPPGTSVTLSARGFAPGEKVQIFVGQATRPALTATADQYGNFWGAGPIQVPYQSGEGSLSLKFVGQDSGAEVAEAFKVLAAKPWLDLSQWSGPPGAAVSFSGGGWAAGERVDFHLGSASGPLVGSAQANAQGWLPFSGSATVPASAANSQTQTFVAVGEESHATASADFKVVDPFQSLPQNLP